jgi:hypothetical protein
MAIDVVNTRDDALLKLVLGGHPDVAQDRTGELGKEALNEVEPGGVLGREGELEAFGRPSGEPGSGFSRYVGGMIVEDQLDRGARRIGGIEQLEEFDELAAAAAVSDERMDLAGQQINSGQQAERAMTSILMIARLGRVDAWHGRRDLIRATRYFDRREAAAKINSIGSRSRSPLKMTAPARDKGR